MPRRCRVDSVESGVESTRLDARRCRLDSVELTMLDTESTRRAAPRRLDTRACRVNTMSTRHRRLDAAVFPDVHRRCVQARRRRRRRSAHLAVVSHMQVCKCSTRRHRVFADGRSHRAPRPFIVATIRPETSREGRTSDVAAPALPALRPALVRLRRAGRSACARAVASRKSQHSQIKVGALCWLAVATASAHTHRAARRRVCASRFARNCARALLPVRRSAALLVPRLECDAARA